MSDNAEADKPVAEGGRQMTCPVANKGKDIGQSVSAGVISTCGLGQTYGEGSMCCGTANHDKIHSTCDKSEKPRIGGCVIGHQNLCYSYGVKQKTNSASVDGALGQTDWMTPTSQPDWLTPMSQSASDVCGDTVSASDKSKCEDVRLRQWRAAGIALKHALNHIARSQSSDCARDTGRSDVTPVFTTGESAVGGECQARCVTSKESDAMNEMLENAKTLHSEGLDETHPDKESAGQACGSCGKTKSDTKVSSHGDSHDTHVKKSAALNVDGGDAPVNLQQLRERIRKITEKLPISTEQFDHTLVRRPHQSCKVTRLHHMADTDDSDINDPDRKHTKEVRKHVKASRRRSSAGKTPVSPVCVMEGQGHEADGTLSGSSTDPGIVLHAGEPTNEAVTSQNGSKDLEPDHTCKPRETDNSTRKHLPRTPCASGSTSASRPKGLTEADSVANLADVESCTESFDVTEKSSDEKEADVSSTTASGWRDESQEKGVEGTSSTKDNDVASPMFDTPRHNSSLFTPDCDKESDDGFDDLCDLVLDTDESVEEEIQIHVEDIGDFPSGESSGNSEDGGDADDEFECDCTMCHDIGAAMWAARNDAELAEQEEGDSIQHDVSDGYDQPFNFSLSEVCPLDLLLRQSGHHDILQAMFHNVITQMLTVYPDLMSDQVPPLVSDSYIDGLPSVSIKPNGEDDLTCPICLCNFEAGEDAKSLPCQHLFHHLCIKVWIHKSGTCPVCRFILTPDS